MLENNYTGIVARYNNADGLAQELWNKIDYAYNLHERYFHNSLHLQHLLRELQLVTTEIKDWESMIMAVFYHDLAYDAIQYMLENNNEENSADLAEKDLQLIKFPPDKIERVKAMIMATKKHNMSTDEDTNYFIDADISILGQPWPVYQEYMSNIRKEYEVYADNIFKPGRIRFMKTFLNMSPLFKTNHFFNLYETQARENISRELEILSL